eukprot:170843_1
MLLILKQQKTNMLKERDMLLQRLQLKFNAYIDLLLLQQVLISRTITKQYDEMMKKINDSIYNYINNKHNITQNIKTQQIKNNMNHKPNIKPQQIKNDSYESNFARKKINDSIYNYINNKHNITQNIKMKFKPKINAQQIKNETNESNFPPDILPIIGDIKLNENIEKKIKNNNINNEKLQSKSLFKNESNESNFPPNILPSIAPILPQFKIENNNNNIKTKDSKPYKCFYCTNSYKTKSGLKTHITQKHTNNGKYKCRFCVKTFRKPSVLTRHERKHTQERPF